MKSFALRVDVKTGDVCQMRAMVEAVLFFCLTLQRALCTLQLKKFTLLSVSDFYS